MWEKYSLDIPVYRLALDKYEKEREQYVEEQMYGKPPNIDNQMKEFHKREPGMKQQFEHHLWQRYGGSWNYNEIIGWIQLHFLGSQIRGEYWAVKARRITRTRKKTFEFKSWKLAPEKEIPHSASNSEIYEVVLGYIDDCRKELRRRYLDTSRLEMIGPFVDWRSLINVDEKA